MQRTVLFWLVMLTSIFSSLSAQTTFDANEGIFFIDLAVALQQPERVYHLDLSGQGLTEVPQDIERLINLRTLDLSYNEISQFGEVDLSSLNELEAVNLYDNQFIRIPATIYTAGNLRELNLGSNAIQTVDPELNDLKFLRTLKLHHNRLTTLPAGLHLKYLTKLRLDGNRLQSLPEDFFAAHPALSYLNLNANRLVQLPAGLYASNLRDLDVGTNHLTDLNGIERMSHLKNLILDWNAPRPSDIAAIFSLTKLQVLSLENCWIEQLPADLSEMRQLRELSLIGNRLKTLPASLAQLPRLEKLWLSGNPVDEG